MAELEYYRVQLLKEALGRFMEIDFYTQLIQHDSWKVSRYLEGYIQKKTFFGSQSLQRRKRERFWQIARKDIHTYEIWWVSMTCKLKSSWESKMLACLLQLFSHAPDTINTHRNLRLYIFQPPRRHTRENWWSKSSSVPIIEMIPADSTNLKDGLRRFK